MYTTANYSYNKKYLGLLIDDELSVPVYQVRLDWLLLPCIALIWV